MIDVNKLYQVKKISDRVVVIFCTTYINPISYLPVIEEDLGKMNFSGKIFFDLLLSNGFSLNRFVEADVSEAKVNRRSMKVVDPDSIDESLIETAFDFYRSHPYLVENNVILLEDEKYHLIHS